MITKLTAMALGKLYQIKIQKREYVWRETWGRNVEEVGRKEGRRESEGKRVRERERERETERE